MKHAFFAGIALVLALGMVSCALDNGDKDKGKDRPKVVNDKENNQVYTLNADGIYRDKNGRKVADIRLPDFEDTAPVKSARALTDDLAKKIYFDYEVIFRDPDVATEYIRRSWNRGEVATVFLPEGNYGSVSGGTSGNAILLIGRDTMLLAVGSATATDNDGLTIPPTTPTTTPYVTPGVTTSITFTAYSLTTSITDTYSATTSSFAITAPTSHVTAVGSIPVEHYAGVDVPYFKVPDNDTGITATFKIFAGTGTFGTYGPGLVVKDTPTVAPLPQPYQRTTGDDLTTKFGPTIDISFTTLAIGDNLGTGALNFDIDTSTDTAVGPCRVYFSIPVGGLASDVPGGRTWNVRGGYDNAALDLGPTYDTIGSTGGAVLLVAGSIPGPITILTPGYTP